MATSSLSVLPHGYRRHSHGVFLLLLFLWQQQLLWSSAGATQLNHSLIDQLNISIPALFVFGDSTVDPGNNNYLPTAFKGNFPPYGLSFSNHIPSGRFTDGKLATDFLVSYLGIKELVPPYLDFTLGVHDLLTGVSFASAGSGYDPLTAQSTSVLPVNQQLNYMKDCLARMESAVGKARAAKIMEESIFLVSAGTNDFVISYFLFPLRRRTFNLEQYQLFIIDQLQVFIKGLYDLGARRILFAGLPPLGCLPIEMTINFANAVLRQCIDSLNLVAVSYNSKLQHMLNKVKESELKDANIVYADIYEPLLDAIKNPNKYGFKQTNVGCCGTGLLEFGLLCNPNTLVCADPSTYVFWDAIHPTQRTYSLIADALIQRVLHLIL
ncbi:GDSL esterase/lipase At5g45960-like [Nymphaea colorata]|nr:GDSL esterase/lipase At5g45960-like [Nymphaea colorata]